MKHARTLSAQGTTIPLGALKSVRGNTEAVLKSFDEYVTGVGLKFEDYREFVLPWWQNAGADFDLYLAKRITLQPNCAGAIGRVLH